ncbi:hypothetical protein JTE90_018497 [Oedothorax gibbosus]|uniref:Phosphatidylinositol-glycan biosynthesis class W protein n=1 Tax=Oedothorax gibbosus TaxID=931172 RepID=A0AAV6V1A3_9ARAC|nr:hypothetical protein JTE90_018497 [Oedothorax gibbosus]
MNIKNITSGLNLSSREGSTPFEVLSMTFFIPMCSLLLWTLAGRVRISSGLFQAIEVSLLNIILLLGLTLFENKLQLVFSVLFIVIIITFYIVVYQYSSTPHMKYVLRYINSKEVVKQDINKSFVEGYRGHLFLATAICILAVDFNSFPARFAKTETFGWSIMDAGVGSFIVVHGLCSSQGRGLTAKHLKKCFMSSFPLFLLGVVRLVATNAVGYHKVVPEYGLHWNFFFTLAFTKVICYSVLSITNIPSGILAIASMTVHQLLLSKLDLLTLILSEDRETFFKANKEGICSLLGFVSLYFAGVQLGSVVWKKGLKLSEYKNILLNLCAIGAIGWVLMYLCHHSIQPISRRMANLPYCIWVVSLTSLQIALHLCQELIIIILSRLLKNNYSDFLLWKAINYNGLFYFLLANLLTGLVNLSIDTNNSSHLKSFVILITYLTILSVSVITAHKKSIQLKFW